MNNLRNTNWVTFAIVGMLLLGSAGSVFALGSAEATRAEDAFGAQQYADASISYARAAQLLPWRAVLWDQAALSAGLAGDFATALQYLAHRSEHTEAGWAVLAYAYFQKGELTSAIAAYQAGLVAYPNSAALYGGLAETYHLLGNWDAERDAREEQVRNDESDSHAHYQLALLWSSIDTKRALAELTAAATREAAADDVIETMRTTLNIADAQNNPSEKLVTVGRGLGLVGEWGLARDAFQKAIDADADNPEAWAWLGEAEQQTGLDGSAALDQAIALDGESAIVRALRGLQWSRRGEYERMRAEYALAARLEPANPAWQAALGDADLKLGDLAAAIGDYNAAAELAPEDPSYWRLLAMTCAENGSAIEELALPAAQKAAELAPKDPASWDVLGFTYYSSGRYANAEASLKKAIELDPTFYSAYLHLALNYLAQGNPNAAHEALTYARDHDPNGMDGARAAELLKQYFP